MNESSDRNEKEEGRKEKGESALDKVTEWMKGGSTERKAAIRISPILCKKPIPSHRSFSFPSLFREETSNQSERCSMGRNQKKKRSERKGGNGSRIAKTRNDS